MDERKRRQREKWEGLKRVGFRREENNEKKREKRERKAKDELAEGCRIKELHSFIAN